MKRFSSDRWVNGSHHHLPQVTGHDLKRLREHYGLAPDQPPAAHG